MNDEDADGEQNPRSIFPGLKRLTEALSQVQNRSCGATSYSLGMNLVNFDNALFKKIRGDQNLICGFVEGINSFVTVRYWHRPGLLHGLVSRSRAWITSLVIRAYIEYNFKFQMHL